MYMRAVEADACTHATLYTEDEHAEVDKIAMYVRAVETDACTQWQSYELTHERIAMYMLASETVASTLYCEAKN